MPHSRAAGGDLIWRPTRLAIYARDGWRCTVCRWEPPRGAQLRALAALLAEDAALDGSELAGKDTKGLSLDHVRPPSRGGGTGARSLVTMCVSCNSRKGDRALAEVFPGHVAARVLRRLRRRILPELGRALCDVLYPGWLDRQRVRRRDVHRRRSAGLIEREHPEAFFAALAAAQEMS